MVTPILNPCEFGTPEPCGVNPSFTYTRYPCDFDDPRPPPDTRGLPIIVDLQTPVRAEVVNRQREAILAIEGELGIQPSGTFTTVRSRLDAMDEVLCTLWNSIGGGGSPVSVKLNDVTIVSGVQSLNFLGGVTVTPDGLQANINILGGIGDGYAPRHVPLPVSVNGQTSFGLPDTPWDGLLVLFIEGVKQELSDYSVFGSTVTWSGSVALETTDIVEAFYFVENPGTGTVPRHEGFSVGFNGQTVFTLSEGAYSNLLLLFIEGIKQEISDYTVVGDQLTWNGVTPLLTTDVVEVLYFKEAGPGGGGGGGSPLSVADEGVVVGNNITLLDFAGPGVTAALTAPGEVTVSIDGVTTIMHQEVFLASPGQTDFVLSNTPLSQSSTELFIDGISQTIIDDYTLGGSTITYGGVPALTGGEVVVVKYFESVSLTAVGISEVKQDNVTVSSNVQSLNFTGGVIVTDGGSQANIQIIGDNLSVANQNTVIDTNVNLIDFVGANVVATNPNPGEITVTVSGTDTIMYQQVFIASPGQTDFIVTNTPLSQQSTELFINGVSQTVVTDYTLSGSTVTYSGIPALLGGEQVVVKYFESISLAATVGLPVVLAADDSTGAQDIDFGNNSRGINHLDPVNPQDVATKAYVDNNSGSGYLGVDVFVSDVSDFPAPSSGVITLVVDTVYGIDGFVDIGNNSIEFSAGSKIVGGGGSSTKSEIKSDSANPTININANNVSIDGITAYNEQGPALEISGASYEIVDSTFVSDGANAAVLSSPGAGKINNSFVYISPGGSGMLVNQNVNSLLITNTKFIGFGTGNGISLIGTNTANRLIATNCDFSNLDNFILQDSDFTLINFGAINCSGFNSDTFIYCDVGSTVQASSVMGNILLDCNNMVIGLAPGGNQVFRGNLIDGMAYPESPIV
jgi:hypothetical protein